MGPDNPQMPLIRALTEPFLFVLLLVACSPALDWRDVKLAHTPLRLQLPCRAVAQERSIQMVGQRVQWHLMACSSGELTFGVAWADLGNPVLVSPALQELLTAAGTNLAASIDATKPLLVRGATPHAASRQALLTGRRADGQAVQMHLAVFTYGTAVFQVTALGPAVNTEVVDTLMDSLRFQP